MRATRFVPIGASSIKIDSETVYTKLFKLAFIFVPVFVLKKLKAVKMTTTAVNGERNRIKQFHRTQYKNQTNTLDL